MSEAAAARIGDEVMALLGTGEQVAPFSERYPDFDIALAYDVAARVRDLRQARGEHPVGRKIGFTNRSIWEAHGIEAPIWNYVYDRTVMEAPGDQAAIAPGAMPEPRIEPELVLHLAAAPAPGMGADDLRRCVDWVAPGFELVYSIFPGWDFTAADAVAACGVHGALIVGERLDLARLGDPAALSDFTVVLENEGGDIRRGHAGDVLGGPLHALEFLVDEIDRFPVSAPLRAGELVTTGTLTEAMPARPGETWRARFDGIGIGPLQLRFD